MWKEKHVWHYSHHRLGQLNYDTHSPIVHSSLSHQGAPMIEQSGEGIAPQQCRTQIHTALTSSPILSVIQQLLLNATQFWLNALSHKEVNGDRWYSCKVIQSVVPL